MRWHHNPKPSILLIPTVIPRTSLVGALPRETKVGSTTARTPQVSLPLSPTYSSNTQANRYLMSVKRKPQGKASRFLHSTPHIKLSFFVIQKVCVLYGSTNSSIVMVTVQRCVDAGSNVVNLSLGEDAFCKTNHQHGVLTMAVANNAADTVNSIPPSYDTTRLTWFYGSPAHYSLYFAFA
jgi:hypothetical protein